MFKEKLPQIQTQLCLFHVLQNVKREITTTKRGITAIERKRVLAVITDMVYSVSEESYDSLYEELYNLDLLDVMEYFNTNWHGIRLEWALFGRNKYSNYLNYTSNRVESLNQKIKLIITKQSTLTKFFSDLNICIASISSEKDIKAIKSTMKTKRLRILDTVEQKYSDHLTSFAFTKLRDEYAKLENVEFKDVNEQNEFATAIFKDHEIKVTSTTCECWFIVTMMLPCRHILAYLKRKDEDLFVPHLCAERWTRSYFNISHPAIANNINTNSIQTAVTFTEKKTTAEVDKYKKKFNLTKSMCEIMSTKPTDQFDHFYNQLKNISEDISTNYSKQSSTNNTTALNDSTGHHQISTAPAHASVSQAPAHASVSRTPLLREQLSPINSSEQLETLLEVPVRQYHNHHFHYLNNYHR